MNPESACDASTSCRSRWPTTWLLVWSLSSACDGSHDVTNPDAVPSPRLQVAVAANFAPTFTELAARFAARHQAPEPLVSSGATGKLYAQIRAGAPFQVFLAADDLSPALLEREGLTVAGTRITYAIGRLAAWGPDHDSAATTEQAMRALQGVRHLAIANPKTAPYGRAALEVLTALAVRDRAEALLLYGENIAQALQFVDRGGAELGIVAFAQLDQTKRATGWVIPTTMHGPIRQQAVLLQTGAEHPAARALLAFLVSAECQALIRAAGYEVEE